MCLSVYNYMYVCVHKLGTCVVIYKCTCTCIQFLIRFDAWAKLAQQWLLCAPLGIHLEPIKKELMLLVTI